MAATAYKGVSSSIGEKMSDSDSHNFQGESRHNYSNESKHSKLAKGRGVVDRDTDDRYEGEAGIFYSLENNESEKKSDAIRSIEGWIIFVSGIQEEASEEDIYNEFESFGDIKNIHVNLDRRTGFLEGYAFIEYENYEDAKNAIKDKNGVTMLGKTLKVSWAFKSG